MSSLVGHSTWKISFRSPIFDVHARQRKLCSPSVAIQSPPGFSEPRVRRNESLPTASRMTSYVWPFFVKSSFR